MHVISGRFASQGSYRKYNKNLKPIYCKQLPRKVGAYGMTKCATIILVQCCIQMKFGDIDF